MFWAKRRSSRGDPSSASQQQPQQQKRVVPIPSSPPSIICSSPSSSLPLEIVSESLSAATYTASSSRLPLAPLDPQISLSSAVTFIDSLPSYTSSATSVVSENLETDPNFIKGRKILNTMNDSNSQNQPASKVLDSQGRPGPSTGRRVTESPQLASTRPTFQPTWTSAYEVRTDDASLYKELSSFQFGAPVMPASSSPSSSSSPSPTSPTARGGEDDDDLVSPLTVNDVTPRPSVVSTGALNLPNTYRSHVTNDLNAVIIDTPTQASSVHNSHEISSVNTHIYGDAPLYTTSSHPSQSHSPPPAPPPESSISSSSRHRSASPPTRNRSEAESFSRSMFGESGSMSGSNSGFISSSSSASASVTSLTSASNNSLSTSPDEDLASTVGSSRSGHHHDRDIEFSSEEEYEYDPDDGFGYGAQDIEVSSAYWEEGHGDRLDSFYYFGGGGSSVGIGSGLYLSTGRRGSVPMAIPGMSDTASLVGSVPGAAAGQSSSNFSGVVRDREGSIATLRRPSRSLDDELRSFTFGLPSQTQSYPGAVPQSDPLTRGEWSAIESRQEQIQRSRGGLDSSDAATPTLASSSQASGASTTGDITNLGFDPDWSDLRGGITSLNDSDIAGLVDPTTSIAAVRRPSGGIGLNLPFGAGGPTSPGPGSAGSGGRSRMGSWFSWGRRQSEVTVSDDTFIRNVRRWDGAYGTRRRDWSFKREKGVVGAQVSGQAAGEKIGAGPMERTDSTLSGVFGTSSQKGSVLERGSGDKGGEREKDKDKRKVPKGMTVGTSEIWSNELVGRFKVDRKAARPLDPSKPPQQRLNFIHFQGSDSQARNTRPGPPVTVHKHSKAIAFSISRQHTKPRIRPRDGTHPVSSVTSQRGVPIRETAIPRSSMIMLAPKRVQEQYTNTTTTRRLDTHGLLEDPVLGVRREKERRDRELEKERERERRRKAEEEKQKRDGRISDTSQSHSTSSVDTVNSLSNGRELYPTPPPASAPSLHTYPPAPNLRKHASSRSLRSTTASDHPLPPTNPNALLERVSRPTGRRLQKDPYDFDDADEDEIPTRTPHAETYATIDPAQVEQMRHLQGRIDSDQPSRSLFRKILGLSTSSSGVAPLSASIDGSFKAPWLTMAPRAKQEEHERVVANLNESFIDVGLLPSRPVHKSKTSSNPQKQKQLKQRRPPGDAVGGSTNIFEQVPPDALYMLLPLWPGETDPVSEKLPNEPKKPYIPMGERQYLLVYYVADKISPPEHELRSKTELEQRSQKKSRSPTSSADSLARRTDDRSILLSAFHVSARLVGYDELRESGVRVPDEGLSVTGPMSEAVNTMPSPSIREQNQGDFLIGVCQSREAGMEFIQEGLVKMGLCLVVSHQLRDTTIPLDETEELEEPDVVLSPIGRAVVEMAWVGCMALTSFGPTV